jgi:multidrug resistance efflux pump
MKPESTTPAAPFAAPRSDPNPVSAAPFPHPAAGTARSKFSPGGAPRTTPLPKRPKGRLLVGAVLVSLIAVPVYLTWDGFFRYRAYGTIQGRVVRVAPPWQGTVRQWQVRDGEEVRQGQPLVLLANAEIEQRLARAQDELRLAQAALEAQAAQLTLERRALDRTAQRAQAEYYEQLGALRYDQARLSELTANRQRSEVLLAQGAISKAQWEAAQFAEQGQRDKVAQSETAVNELRKRAEAHDAPLADRSARLRPQTAQIEALQAELLRLRAELERGQVLAPVAGRVIRRHIFTGELAHPNEPVVEVLEAGSLEAVLYLSQSQAHELETGQCVVLQVAPRRESLTFELVRVGAQLEPPPPSLARYYRAAERLLPVHYRPLAEGPGMSLPLHSEVRWPRALLAAGPPAG